MAAVTPIPATAIIAGSGLALETMLDTVESECTFEEAGIPTPGPLPGHDRRIVFGYVGTRRVILQLGRFHMYEGVPVETVQRPIEVLAGFGAREVIITNAAGGLDPALEPGALLAITRIFTWPCVHWPDAPTWLESDFALHGCDAEGAYAWVHGPNYETPAEVALLQRMGLRAVGMSTAPELARCQALELRAAIVSCITNTCGGSETLSHDSVIASARRASDRLIGVLRAYLSQPAGESGPL